MLYKNTIDRRIRLLRSEDITEDYLLRSARAQLCGRMDREEGKEILSIPSIDYPRFESNPIGMMNADGTVEVDVRCIVVLRHIRSGEVTEGRIMSRGTDGGRMVVNTMDNIKVAIDEDSWGNVGDAVKVKICHVKYGSIDDDKVHVEARGLIV